MYNKKFWIDASERALSTFAQAAGAVLILSEDVTNVLHVNWLAALSVGLVAAVGAVLKAIAAANASQTASASLATTVQKGARK